MLITEIRLGGVQHVNFLGNLSFLVDNALKVHGVRVIDIHGQPTIIMPTRDRKSACDRCLRGVPIMHTFCGFCGARQRTEPASFRESQADVIHPITLEARQQICGTLLAAFYEQFDSSVGADEVQAG